ncbi:MAG: hypothetical protein ACRDOE_00020 [Streptosporangiaceae bacterium]
MATIRKTRAAFRTLFQQADIYDESDPQRHVWMLVERDAAGVAVHIFLEKPPVAVGQEGFSARTMPWVRRIARIFTRQKPPPLLPYVPYASAIIGIQIQVHDNTVESVVWNPVPGEDDFQEDPDAPENPTVQVLIGNIDAYRPPAANPEAPSEPGSPDDHPL